MILEGQLIKKWKPKYNTDFTDDKRFLLVRLDRSRELPRFTLARFKKEDGARYFGPFAHAYQIRKTLGEMRREFGILLSDSNPKRLEDGRFRLYEDVRSELYGHDNIVSQEMYLDRVDKACDFLQGKSKEWLEDLKSKMNAAADKKHFEKAAEYRDIVYALEASLKKTRKFERQSLPKEDKSRTLDQLGEVLGLPRRPFVIECFDISHISGTFVVASMVRFENGVPNKQQYRRYKIRSFEGNDDFRSMEEVVGRRYRRLDQEGKPFPDLVVIDGGKGQVAAAGKAFLIQDLEVPPLIGLAKKKEIIIFSDEREPLLLDARSSTLQLLQRLRDEAHRFANTYNADLRSKKLKESLLDDFPGLGPEKRSRLLSRFKSIDGLRQASIEDLVSVEGIGGTTAKRLQKFLDTNRKR